MSNWIRKIIGKMNKNDFLIQDMDLDRDYFEIDRLFRQEEWPFLRDDLEISHQQPGATSFVARKLGRFAGFFATHSFGEVAYLDMMIAVPEFRKAGITRRLYSTTMRALKEKGITAFVVHTTNDSAPLIRFIGFKPGQSFTLMRREPGQVRSQENSEPAQEHPARLVGDDLDNILALDAAVFNLRRDHWIRGLLSNSQNRFFGLRGPNSLRAAVCLRPRYGNALCIDGANCFKFRDLETVIRFVVDQFNSQRLECFVRTGSELHQLLESSGFFVPEFFKAIGPLIEWRKGPTGDLGLSEKIQTLNWF